MPLEVSASCATLLAADRAWFAANAPTAADLTAALRTLCHVEPQLALDLGLHVFPQAW